MHVAGLKNQEASSVSHCDALNPGATDRTLCSSWPAHWSGQGAIVKMWQRGPLRGNKRPCIDRCSQSQKVAQSKQQIVRNRTNR
eukprot:4336465-Amphidinium_carterae.1